MVVVVVVVVVEVEVIVFRFFLICFDLFVSFVLVLVCLCFVWLIGLAKGYFHLYARKTFVVCFVSVLFALAVNLISEVLRRSHCFVL